jgi:hypothetical protein
MCLAPDTPITTPEGERPVAALRTGDLVYSTDAAGRVVIVPIARTSRTPAQHHTVVQLLLDNGAVIRVSAAHPLVGGGTVGALIPGSALGAARVVAVESIPYDEAATFDVLPANETGTYFASGALLASTLAAR